ncbi:Dor1-domain-containing protein [Dacryopinax primogenitus]|uniref:Conserved oligomeric Golgi complex subunit 8 n=1 Tax=Dacryopinax primogenitus (strain DJM 731) TaxID=1858805 RepID=M5G1X6_DACPD|nr:Dor1-domain-containing protein [Dacryopinax primogenitus]EJU02694.1 Dor1-domain-containing protein [Dacryopinax primogenitus]
MSTRYKSTRSEGEWTTTSTNPGDGGGASSRRITSTYTDLLTISRPFLPTSSVKLLWMETVAEETSSGRTSPVMHTLVDLPPSLIDLISASDPTPAAQSYLSYISSLDLPTLLQEPSQLTTESATITSELTGLCQREYRTFLSVHQTTTSLSSSLGSLSSSLTSLLDELPALDTQCRAFADQTKILQASRQRATLVLEQSDKLLDILEIPQLLDTCVRNGHYQEALDLSAHATSLLKRFPSVQVVRDVAAEVDATMRQMLIQLLHVLREPAKLPNLFKAINFLRRMQPAPLTEPELALAFLTSRMSMLSASLHALEPERSVDPARYVRKYVDAFREGAYDILTQYTTIFLDRPSANKTPELQDYLTSFSHHLLSTLIGTLETALPLVEDASALSSLLTQLSYCSASFARIGLDFRALLAPLFEQAVLSATQRSLHRADSTLSTSLTAAGKSARPPSTFLLAFDAPESLFNTHTHAHTFTPQNPPAYLASLPPLATYLNSQLTTLNSLRLLAPSALLSPLLEALDASLCASSTALLTFCRSAWGTVTRRTSFEIDDSEREKQRERDKKVLLLVGRAWVDALGPFLRTGLVKGVYGREEAEESESWTRAKEEWDTWWDEIGERRRASINGVVEEERSPHESYDTKGSI